MNTNQQKNFKYKTISTVSKGLFKDKNSKFLAFAFPFSSEGDLKKSLQALQNEHKKAVHFCFAYRLGLNGEKYRISDDGEPAGSAGNPILGQLTAFDLTNCLVVVVRYYGGIKLGVGGLINAYKTATNEALSRANHIEKEIKSWFKLTCEYPDIAPINLWIKQAKLEMIEQNFDLLCTFKIGVAVQEEKLWKERFRRIKTIQYEELGIY